MKVRCINAKGYRESLREGNIYEGKLKFNNLAEEKRWIIEGIEAIAFNESRFEEVKELTFQEVIANIKDGEVWECTREDARVKEIKKNGEGKSGLLVFNFGQMTSDVRASIQGGDKFKLKRKEYTFEEAFKAYEEGKEIESVITAYAMKKLENGTFKISQKSDEFHTKKEGEVIITLQEIKGKWYIND